MTLEILPMEAKYLEDAAALVVDNFRALRRRIPRLPARYEQPLAIVDLLGKLENEARGAVALQAGRLAGFLSGSMMPNFYKKRAFYSPEWANAAEEAFSREVYEALYAYLSPIWLREGCQALAVSLMAHDEPARQVWGWLGFGILAVDALRGMEPLAVSVPEIEIRQAGAADLPALGELLAGLSRHLAGPPVFLAQDFPRPADLLAKPGYVMWLAFEAGEAVGFLGMDPDYRDGCLILQDEDTIQVEPAYISEKCRGAGVGKALLEHALAEARRQGYLRCSVDFESPNILASRFWLKRFEPACYSLMRVIDMGGE